MLTTARAAAVALALRLYAAEHGGETPATLGELVPRYLKAVPADPFAADGRPLRYVRGEQTVVYSVSEDGVDDGGDAAMPAGQRERDPVWTPRDAVFPLTGRKREAPVESGPEE
jgi:hypothetical protein